MNNMHKMSVVDFLINNRLVDVEAEERIVTESYGLSDGGDVGVTASGLEYPKKTVMKYMTDNGYPITQENLELVVKKMHEKGELSSQKRETIYKSSIDNASDEELKDALDLGTARLIEEIRDQTIYGTGNYTFSFHISYFADNSNGILPVDDIVNDITEMKREGWEIKHLFTKNRAIVRRGVSVAGVAAVEEKLEGVLYIIYERRNPVR